MCGIAGYVDFNGNTTSDTLFQMVQALHHRGPDDKGYENFDRSGIIIGLGQARLSIIDLSSTGHQPMSYKAYTIVFNGEIYNYKELRKDLEKSGHKFISDSDTEVILHSFEHWGTEFVHQLIGMFVIVIYVKNEDKLFIFRDRAGVKPIFYYWHNGLFLFASELKSLFVHTKFRKEIDENSLILFFDFGFIPAPYSIFKNTYKIEPGKYLVVDLKQKELLHYRYWNIDDYYCKSKFRLDYEEAKVQVRDLLISSCNYRMVADVPVGVFLSGGYDSSVVTAMLQKDRTDKLKTFTIGFEEGNNEAPFAKKVAQYLHTDHTEYICTTLEAQNIIPDLPYFYDEPFADSSAIPTMLVSKVARNDVKVALSADAGDELFAGYTDYSKFDRQFSALNKIPKQLNFILRPSLAILSDLTPKGKSELKHKLKSVANALNNNKFTQAIDLRRLAVSLPEFYQANLFNNINGKYQTIYNNDFSNFSSILEIALAIDYHMYLQDDILTKVDRASMSVSLEGREPLLDHRLAEFVAQLPNEYKYKKQKGKIILKDIVYEYLPRELVDRPKAGFSLPIYKWLTGDLSYLIDEFLNEKSISESNLFNTVFVAQQVDLFRKNRFYYKPIIWRLLMFQMWYSKWIK